MSQPFREWDAAMYDRVSGPQLKWGLAVLDRLRLRGDERVLDVGSGSGRVTEQLLERLPDGHVIALDASSAMIEVARARLARFADRVSFVVADVGRPLPIDRPVDAILSTATFHWVPDHDALFRHLAAVLRPGGQLAAQFGGRGNVASVMRVLASVGDGWLGPAHFESVLATVRRLDAAGFVDVSAWLNDEPTLFEAGAPFEAFLATAVLGPQLDRLAEPEQMGFVREVARRLGRPVLDYVRLNVVARRAAAQQEASPI